MVMFQILLDGAEPCDTGTTQLSSPVCRRGGQQDPLGIVSHTFNKVLTLNSTAGRIRVLLRLSS